MLLLQARVARGPLCPTLIHDDATRVVVSVAGILLCLAALYFIGRYFNGD